MVADLKATEPKRATVGLCSNRNVRDEYVAPEDLRRLEALASFSWHELDLASSWDEPAKRIAVRPALDGSYEALFHEASPSDFLLDLTKPSTAVAALREPRLERAIGVIYRAETERMSHYFHARLPRQFDLVLHYDTTRAVVPLHRTPEWELGESMVPGTCPPTA